MSLPREVAPRVHPRAVSQTQFWTRVRLPRPVELALQAVITVYYPLVLQHYLTLA